MSDIRNPKLLYLKGLLFLILGLMAAGILLAEHFDLRFAALLAIAIWAFARAYYFMFYVIEHYIDPGYKFAGLWSFVQYLIRRRDRGQPATSPLSPHGREVGGEGASRNDTSC